MDDLNLSPLPAAALLVSASPGRATLAIAGTSLAGGPRRGLAFAARASLDRARGAIEVPLARNG